MVWKIIGHESLLGRLESFLQNPSGALLFFGAPSVGKRTVAFEMSRAMLCSNRSMECECLSCKKFQSGHPDFLSVGTMGRVKVDDVEKILSFSFTTPLLSSFKIVVIDNIDTMTWEAANRLLKVMEEPPPNLIFFLISANIGSVIPTVVSRCLCYEFESLSPENVANILWKRMGYDLPAARAIGWLAAGSKSDIFSKAGKYLNYRDAAVTLFSEAKNKSVLDFLDFVDRTDFQDLLIIADILLLLATDLLLIKNKAGTIVNMDARQVLEKASEQFKDMGLISFINIMSQVKRNAYLNVNLNFALKNALIKTVPAIQL